MALIEDINPATPNDDPDEVAGGAAQFRQLKTDVLGSFPNLGSTPVTVTADHINDTVTVAVLSSLYPVGSIFIGGDPTAILGGTWVSVEDMMLIGASATYPAGTTGGNKDAVTVAHTHPYSGQSGGRNELHTHNLKLSASPGTNTDTIQADVGDAQNATVTTSSDTSDHTHSYTGVTDSQGVSGTDANLPPYLAVEMWQRTA